jgi:hypothetical protein
MQKNEKFCSNFWGLSKFGGPKFEQSKFDQILGFRCKNRKTQRKNQSKFVKFWLPCGEALSKLNLAQHLLLERNKVCTLPDQPKANTHLFNRDENDGGIRRISISHRGRERGTRVRQIDNRRVAAGGRAGRRPVM